MLVKNAENIYPEYAAAKEFDDYYSTYNSAAEILLPEMERIYAQMQGEDMVRVKEKQIAYLCDVCRVHLFEHCDFFFEMASGRGRHTWGGLQSPVGTFLWDKNASLWRTPYADALSEDRHAGYLHGWDNPVGIDHHCLGYDTILHEGFEGILRRIEAMGDSEYLRAMGECCRSFLRLAKRFSDAAYALAEKADTKATKQHYLAMAKAAENVPAKPAATFYEALCCIVFCRECLSSLEGIGVSTFGHLDRMLYPYYEKDIAENRITPQYAKKLFHQLFTYTDVRFESRLAFNETSTTILLGGCDEKGNVVFNDITTMILECVKEGGYVNTKVNCRISSSHPEEYFRQIAAVQVANVPCVVMENDDCIVSARIAHGQKAEDARLYVSGGCHEVVLANTEVNTRADTWINMAKFVLDAMQCDGLSDFDAFYGEYLRLAKAYILRLEGIKNKYEAMWFQYSPLPLYSATITGCIEQGKDVTQGGARYSSTALSMLAAATTIDSLYAVKTIVYEEKKHTLPEFRAIVRDNFEGNERLRQYILHRIPKYGTDDAAMNAFGARVLKDLSGLFMQENGRGGKYLPAFYPHDIFIPLGQRTGATPDGRLAGAPLSRGCSPSEFIRSDSPMDVIRSVGETEFRDFCDSFVLELTLPRMDGEEGVSVLVSLIKQFLSVCGSSLQFNLLDRKILEDARRNPESHAGLMVRVCGYSAEFVTLDDAHQEEIVERAIR